MRIELIANDDTDIRRIYEFTAVKFNKNSAEIIVLIDDNAFIKNESKPIKEESVIRLIYRTKSDALNAWEILLHEGYITGKSAYVKQIYKFGALLYERPCTDFKEPKPVPV